MHFRNQPLLSQLFHQVFIRNERPTPTPEQVRSIQSRIPNPQTDSFRQTINEPTAADYWVAENSHPPPRAVYRIIKSILGFERYKSAPPTHTVPYAQHGHWDLFADVYLPEGQAPEGGWPAVVMVHGSAFLFANRTCIHNRHFAMELSKKGHAVVCLDYRKIPHTHGPFPFASLSNGYAEDVFNGLYPRALEDVLKGFEWWNKSAELYGCDPNKTTSMGLSAGGLFAYSAAQLRPDLIKDTVLVYPFLDKNLFSSTLSHLFGRLIYGFWDETYEAPSQQFNGELFMIHGREDHLTPMHHSLRLALQRAEHGLADQTYLHIEDDGDHAIFNQPSSQMAQRLTRLVERFFDRAH